MAKNYKISEFDENKTYDSHDTFTINDKSRKFDEETGEFVSPNDPKYDALPDLVL